MQSFAIDNRGFHRALWGAASLHLMIFLALGALNLKTKNDFPFQIVNIRLGDGSPKRTSGTLGTEAPAGEISKTTTSVKDDAFKPPTPQIKPTIKPESDTKTAHIWKRSRSKGDNFRPVARTLDDYVKKGDSGTFGIAGFAPETDAEVTQRYTQVLSLWLYKFRDYPEQARKEGLSGKALIRLRIERTGRILFYQLDKPTGQPILDSAIRDMVYRASPVPEAPAHFPGGQQLEFLIPIAFSLD